MGRKRAADEAGPSNASKESNEPENRRDSAAGAPDRRKDMADLARRRAAHFATWESGDGEVAGDAGNPHVGGSAARSLGPWSSAVQLANAREKQKEQREDKIRDAARSKGSEATKGWTPSRDPGLGPRRPFSSVTPLALQMLRLVADSIEDVETLCGLPDLVKSRIAGEVCSRRALTPAALRLFVEHSPAEVAFADCTQLGPEVLGPALLEAATPRLEKLHLGLCGRGLTDAVAASLAARGVISGLSSLSLGGAYRLTDAGLLAVLEKVPGLSMLAVPLCPRIEGTAVEALPRLTPGLRHLNLAGCRGLSKETLRTALVGLPQLQTLSLDGIAEVDDDLVEALAGSAPGLRNLSLAACPTLTDAGIAALASAVPGLRSLSVNECKIGPAGVRALAKQCTALQEVSLERCTKVDDDAVAALAALGTLRHISLNSLPLVTGVGVEALARGCAGTLEEADLSWCRAAAPSSLGRLADSCGGLRRLALWGCTQADASFLYGHSNDLLELVGVGEVLLPAAL